MRAVWMLVMANFRKNKGQAIGMLILILMTAMFMNIGLSMYFSVGNYYDERAEELNTPDFVTQEKENIPNTARYNFITEYPGVNEVETQSILHGIGALLINGERATTSIIIADGTAKQHMNPPHLVGEYMPLKDNAIYIPYSYFLSESYSIGDTFTLEFAGKKLEFIVAGSTEEIFFGISPRLYISSDAFHELQNCFEKNRFTLIVAHVEDGSIESLSESYESTFTNDDNGGFLTLSYPQVRATRVTNAMVGALFIITFSLIILVIGIIVLCYRISTDIEENMTNIGVLKAMGYQNKQVILSIVLQYGVIAFVGSAAGVLIAHFILPMAGSALETILGIPWRYKVRVLHMAVPFIFVQLLVEFFAGISSWRINNLHPLTALYNKSTNYMKKNLLPLETSHAPLSFLFAMKHLLQNKKQAIAFCIIITGLTFACTFGLTVYYFVNSDALRQSIMFEVIDVSIEINDSAQGLAFRERALALPEVSSIYGRDELKLNINNMQVTTTIVEDFSYVHMNLVSGRFPLHDNEIVMGGAAMLSMGVSLGDWVSIDVDGRKVMYLIVGMVQTQTERGLVAVLDMDSFRVIQPDFAFDAFAMVLTQGADGFSLVDYLSTAESSIISDIFYTRPFIEVQLNVVGSIFTNISIVLLFMVAGVVTMVLFLVIKTNILHERRELGIQKALGFTNLQLMNQIVLNLLPATLIGVIIGIISGIFAFNPIYIAFLKDYGIVYSNIYIPYSWIIAMFFSLILLNYIVSMFVARRIRKIAAYVLVTE